MALKNVGRIGLGDVVGRSNYTNDCWVEATEANDGHYDLLIFADSRGFLLDRRSGSWTLKLFRHLRRQGLTAMVVVRPKDLTGFFTLFNFLESAKLRFKFAVCQAGLVEFTPKTDALLEDLFRQKDVLFPALDLVVRDLDESLVFRPAVNGGQPSAVYERLHAVDVDVPTITDEVVKGFERHFAYTLLLGAVELDPQAKSSRLRPKSFFEQVRLSNRWLRSLAERSFSIHYIEPIKGWSKDGTLFVHDGAHYTARTHDRIYETVKAVLRANLVSTSAHEHRVS